MAHVLAFLAKVSMNTTCSINCRQCLEDYSQTLLAHTQSQISILVGLNDDSKIASKDAGLVSSGDVPHLQVSDPPNTDPMEEARNLIDLDTSFSQN